MLYGARLLEFAGFPALEILGPDASAAQIAALIERYGSVLVKPVFEDWLVEECKVEVSGRAYDLGTALEQKQRLSRAQIRRGERLVKARGVTVEAALPAEYEIYFSITETEDFRAPVPSHQVGVALGQAQGGPEVRVPFEAGAGLHASVVAQALCEVEAPWHIIPPLVRQLPKLWDLYRSFDMSMLELNPIRMWASDGKLTPVACDFKCGFERNESRRHRFHRMRSDQVEFFCAGAVGEAWPPLKT